MDVLDRADLPFPHSLPEFQRLFPDDAACAAYLEQARWGDGFACPHCGTAGEPFHFENRPGVLRCRKCRQNTGLTVGTVMGRSHTPLNVWFWAAYLVASQTPGMSAVQFQRQLGLSRYETAFQILHKLRSGMVRPNQDRIGGQPKNHVEVDETWVGGRTRGEGRGVHHKVPVSCAIEVRHRKPGTKFDNRKDGRYAGRVRLAVVLDRSAESLCGFVESTVAPGSLIVTDDWSGYAGLGKRGYEHFAVAECGDSEVAEQYLPIIHLVFANLKTWLIGIHHGVSHQHLQAYLNEFTFRFNRRFYPFNAFRSLLGIAGDTSAPTYAGVGRVAGGVAIVICGPRWLAGRGSPRARARGQGVFVVGGISFLNPEAVVRLATAMPSQASASGGRVKPASRSSAWLTSWDAICQRSGSRSPRRVWCLSAHAMTTRAIAVSMRREAVSATQRGE